MTEDKKTPSPSDHVEGRTYSQAELDEAIKQEREGCAFAAECHSGFGDHSTIEQCAALIRARGDEEEDCIHVPKDVYARLISPPAPVDLVAADNGPLTVSYPVHMIAHNLLLAHTGQEGGCPKIDWYKLRGEISDAIAVALDKQRKLDTPPQELRGDECDHKGKGLAFMSWGACCKGCGEPYPFDDKQKQDASAVTAILTERARQIAKGYDAAHDDKHIAGDIINSSWGATARIYAAQDRGMSGDINGYKQYLTQAAAQIIAEVERVDRADSKPTEACPDCGRHKAKSADDAAAGLCPKWWAIRDPDAERDCERETPSPAPNGIAPTPPKPSL